MEESAVNDSLILAKSSLNINLLPETEDDRNMASLLSLRPSQSIEESQSTTRNKILNAPALPSSSGLLTSFGGLKKEESLSKSVPLSRNALGIMVKTKKVENAIKEKVNSNNSNTTGDKSNCDKSKNIIKLQSKVVSEKTEDEENEHGIKKGDKKVNEKINKTPEMIINENEKCKNACENRAEGKNNNYEEKIEIMKESERNKNQKAIESEGKCRNIWENKVEGKSINEGENKNENEDKISEMKNDVISHSISLVCDYSSSGESSDGEKAL